MEPFWTPPVRIAVVAVPSLKLGTALLVAPPSAEHRLAMEGMTVEARARYMVEHRLAVSVVNAGGDR